MNEANLKNKLRVYMEAFLESYQETVNKRYLNIVAERDGLGKNLDFIMMSFYGRQLGDNAALSAVYSEDRTYIYVLVRSDEEFEKVAWVGEVAEFKTETFRYDREKVREDKVRRYLGIDAEPLGGIATNVLFVGRMISIGDDDLAGLGKAQGATRAHNDATYAESLLSQLRPLVEAIRKREFFKREFIGLQGLCDRTITVKERGDKFEDLVRRVLDHDGWNIKEIKKTGEQIDFTGILEGNHILGEVKWETEPLEADEMRNFMTRLAPRPQSIGLFVSHAGYTKGALNTIKENSHKIVVTFSQSDIESIFLRNVNPRTLFNKKLRDRLDYIFSF